MTWPSDKILSNIISDHFIRASKSQHGKKASLLVERTKQVYQLKKIYPWSL
jgi:hypothetical protein